MLLRALPALGLLACVTQTVPQDPSGWYDAGTDLWVTEPLAFTDQNYDFHGATKIAELPLPPDFGTIFDPSAEIPAGCAEWSTDSALPADIEGIVTIYPRYYFKTAGCNDDEEKYYGSYFIQDDSGGIFVLGDTKVAAFSAGARVSLQVRAMSNRFDLVSVKSADVTDVATETQPIYYEVPSEPLGAADVGLVRRVTGEVVTPMDTFGAFQILAANGNTYDASIDSELNKRGFAVAVGDRVTVTGPVLYSFSLYTMLVLQIGQIQVEPAE